MRQRYSQQIKHPHALPNDTLNAQRPDQSKKKRWRCVLASQHITELDPFLEVMDGAERDWINERGHQVWVVAHVVDIPLEAWHATINLGKGP